MFNYLATSLYAVLLLVVSVAPRPQLPRMPDVPLADKWAHLLAYAIFAWLLYRSAKTLSYSDRKATWVAWAIATLFGIAMEGMQYVSATGRYFEVWDMIANSLGAVFALLLIRIIRFY